MTLFTRKTVCPKLYQSYVSHNFLRYSKEGFYQSASGAKILLKKSLCHIFTERSNYYFLSNGIFHSFNYICWCIRHNVY